MTPNDQALPEKAGLPSASDDSWQPISTAPKDETPLILCFPEKEGITVDIGRWAKFAYVPGWRARLVGWVNPTHWQPVPLPPNAPGERRGEFPRT